MPYTRGFRRLYLRNEHFDKHGAEVGADDESHYEELADVFLGAPISTTAKECVRRSDGFTLRWDRQSNFFGVLSYDGYILTFYMIDPAWHRMPSNRAYFESECNKR